MMRKPGVSLKGKGAPQKSRFLWVLYSEICFCLEGGMFFTLITRRWFNLSSGVLRK